LQYKFGITTLWLCYTQLSFKETFNTFAFVGIRTWACRRRVLPTLCAKSVHSWQWGNNIVLQRKYSYGRCPTRRFDVTFAL